MRIIYLGKHGNTIRSNDDEGAITRSLIELGHEVHLVPEQKVNNILSRSADVILFNHYRAPIRLADSPIPKVFWYFDRVECSDDRSLIIRDTQRKAWIQQAMEVSSLGFMTDGDWVAKDKTNKLIWLPQGFNQYLKPAIPSGKDKGTVLFTGGAKGGVRRESFVREMRERYGDKFIHHSTGLYGERLAQAIADASIVVAPDYPVTDRYWSNRVYLTMGLGGFLLHPYSHGIEKSYNGARILTYRTRDELVSLIDWAVLQPQERKMFSDNGQKYTIAHHTYKNRCEQLITIVKERLGI